MGGVAGITLVYPLDTAKMRYVCLKISWTPKAGVASGAGLDVTSAESSPPQI